MPVPAFNPNAAYSSTPPAQAGDTSGSVPAFDPTAAYSATPPTSTVSQPTKEPGFLTKLGNLIFHPIDTLTADTTTPEEKAEDAGLPLVHLPTAQQRAKLGNELAQGGIGIAKSAGQTAMAASRAAEDVGSLGLDRLVKIPGDDEARAKIDNALKLSSPDQQGGASIEQVLEFALGGEALKGMSLADQLGESSKLFKVLEKYPRIARILTETIKGGTVGGAVGGAHGGAVGAAEGAAGGAAFGGGGAALSEIPGAIGDAVQAVRGTDEQPGLYTKLRQGSEVSQNPTLDAVQDAVDSGTRASGTNGSVNTTFPTSTLQGTTIIDDQINALAKKAKLAYAKVDDMVGFDLKAEKNQLANDKYALNQLGNTDIDLNRKANLIEAINDSTDRIAEAEGKLKDAGIDPNEADQIHRQQKASEDFRKVLIRTTNPDGSFNVDKLLKQSTNLRYSKYGDRLEQAFGGKVQASVFLTRLNAARNMGISAVNAQKMAKINGQLAAGVAGAGALYELGRHATSAVLSPSQ